MVTLLINLLVVYIGFGIGIKIGIGIGIGIKIGIGIGIGIKIGIGNGIGKKLGSLLARKLLFHAGTHSMYIYNM